MARLGIAVAAAMIAVIFIDTFEAIILPRRVRHSYRLARYFYRYTWLLWNAVAKQLPAGRWRHAFLSTYGPLSLFALMVVWAAGLITGFALLHWSLDTKLTFPSGGGDGFFAYIYFSGTTFFTLGYGDIVPSGALGRALSIAEAGIGFGFLAVVISYLPVVHQAFSRREITISLLDARAGSPPSAGEFLRRVADAGSLETIGPLLTEWERWAAELLESHLSFPVLRYYRSQHDNQSWVGTLTAILDTSAFLIAAVDHPHSYQARLTFAMARHAAVDLVLVARKAPQSPEADRLPATDLTRLLGSLQEHGCVLRDEQTLSKSLMELRALYEPFIYALATDLQFPLPSFVTATRPVDNWQTSPGMQRSPGLSDLQAASAQDEHND